MNERREYPRYDIIAQIRVKRGRVNYLMDVDNISFSGLLISTEGLSEMPWFRVDQELDLNVFTTEDLENTNVKGKIVRIVSDDDGNCTGFGVHFGDMNDATRERLSELISKADSEPIRPPPLANPAQDVQTDTKEQGEDR